MVRGWRIVASPLPQWSLPPLRVTSLWSVGLRQISPVPGGQKPQWGREYQQLEFIAKKNKSQSGLFSRLLSSPTGTNICLNVAGKLAYIRLLDKYKQKALKKPYILNHFLKSILASI